MSVLEVVCSMLSNFSLHLGKIIREETQRVLKERRTKNREVVFHGTSSKFLNSILTNGLVPNPKEKTWEDDPQAETHTPSRHSYGGAYFTNNILTARIAGQQTVAKYGGNRIIISALVQPKSALPDEDDIKSILGSTISKSVRSGDYFYGTVHELENIKKYEDYRKEIVENVFKQLLEKYKEVTQDYGNKKFEEYLRKHEELIFRTIISYYERILAHEKSRYLYYDYSEIQEFVKSPQEAEKNYADNINKFSTILKKISSSPRKYTGDTNFRVMEPVGYSGRNRILSIVEIEASTEDKYKPVYIIRYGEPPEEFWEQTREKSGSDFGIVDKRVR